MPSKCLRSRKTFNTKEILKNTKKKNELSKHVEPAMTAEVLKELKSMKSEFTVQMMKLGDDFTNFQQEKNARLSKIDNIDNLNVKARELDEEVNHMKDSLTSTKSFVGELEDKMVKFKKRNMDLLEHLERYSGDFNICLIGVDEEEGEDCRAIVLYILTLPGFEDTLGEIENPYCTGTKCDNKPRYIIAKLHRGPFKRSLLQVVKDPDKKDVLSGIHLVEDFTPGDFELCKKALPLRKKLFEEGK